MAETFFTIYTGTAGRVDIGYDYSQNVTNNTTSLTVKAYLVKTNSAYSSFNNYHKTFTLGVNGTNTNVTYDFDFRNMSTGVRYLITTASRTITHNSDGSVGNIPVSVYYASDTSGLGTVSGSSSIPIATIPRASVPSLGILDNNIGNVITIYTNRASTSFTHTITYAFGSASGTIATGVTTSYGWTTPSSLANQIPTATSGTGTITVKTYSGSTYIGAKSINFTITIPNIASYQPTASTPSKAIYGSGRDKTIAKYVQNISKVTTSFTATAQGGATITSSSINIKHSSNGNSMNISGTSGTSGVLTLAGTYTITATTTDSRGRSKTSSTTFVVEAYAVPKITSYSASRNSSTSTTVNNNGVGTYTYMGGSNPLTVNIAKKLVTASTYTSLNTTAGTTSGTFSNTYASTGNIDTASYNFKLTISDTFGNSAVSVITVSTSSVALSIKRDTGIGVGKVWEQGTLDVAGAIVLNGENLENKFQLKLRTSSTGSATYYIKLAEMTTAIGSGRSAVSFLIDGLGNFGSALFGSDIVHMSTRNGSSVRFRRLLTGSGGAYGYVVNTSTGLTELWVMLAGYNYALDISVLLADCSNTLNYGILSVTTTAPAGFVSGYEENNADTLDGYHSYAFEGVAVRGGNAYGEYVKFANGLMICWYTGFSLSYVNSSYYHASWQFPIAFLAGTVPVVTGAREPSLVGNTYIQAGVFTGSCSTTSAYIRMFSYNNNFPTGHTPLFNVTVIGRWK